MATFISEPIVTADRHLGTVTLDMRSEEHGRTIRILQGDPASSEDCDQLLAWAERMEAAVDNLVSELRLIQGRMDNYRDGTAMYGNHAVDAPFTVPPGEEVLELPDDHPSWGAGGRATYDQG
jgi:hypothetical protein